MKYADNILKGFAAAMSIVLSSLISYFLLGDLELTSLFVLVTATVISSVFMYSYEAPKRPPVRPADSNIWDDRRWWLHPDRPLLEFDDAAWLICGDSRFFAIFRISPCCVALSLQSRYSFVACHVLCRVGYVSVVWCALFLLVVFTRLLVCSGWWCDVLSMVMTTFRKSDCSHEWVDCSYFGCVSEFGKGRFLCICYCGFC